MRPLTRAEVAMVLRMRYGADYEKLMRQRYGACEGRGMPNDTDPRIMAMCYRRDRAKAAVCWICKQPIDYEARRSSTDDAWEGDHYHPRKTHPELANEPSNILPAHRKCNRARQAKAGITNLGQTSRKW